MSRMKNRGVFTIYVIVVMWYIFMSGSIKLRPLAGVAWFALALFGMVFNLLSSKENVTKQARNYFAMGMFFLISCLYSLNIFGSLRYLLTMIMFFFIAYIITNTPEKVEIVLKVCTGYCVFLGIVTFIQMLLPNVYTSVFLPFLPYSEVIIFFMQSGSMCGFTNQTGSNAFWMVMGLGLSYFLIEKNKPLKYMTALLFFVALLTTGRRGPTVIAAAVLLFIGFKGGMRGWFKRIAIFFVALFLLNSLSEFIPYINNVSEKFEILAESENLLNGRDTIFMQMFEGIGESPLFGHGLYSLSSYMPDSGTGQFVSHNAYLQYAFEVGLIGMFFVIRVLAFPVVKGVDFLRSKSKENSKIRFCLFMQIFLLTWGLVESAFYDQYRLFLMIVFQLSMLTLIDYHEDSERIEKCPEQIKR